MIKLSDRLQIIADRIRDGETMADIGTDHGFLPIYLVQSERSPKVIMADVSVPSLSKAEANAQMLKEELEGKLDRMDFRAGDGIQVLENAEVDAVVIAGMGGKLIRDILAYDMEHTRSFRKFILQPRIGQGHLRKWLADNGFVIIHEDVVIEGNYIPEIITVLTDSESEGIHKGYTVPADAYGDDILWKIPPWIVDADGPVDEFLKRNIGLEEEKLANVKLAKVRNAELEAKFESNIEYLNGLLKEYENGKK